MSAWVKQFQFQVAKLGADKASWYCVWYEPSGTRRSKSFGPGREGRDNAKRRAKAINQELAAKTYEAGKPGRTLWSEFAKKFDELHLSKKKPGGRVAALQSLKAFARILKLDSKPLSCITAESIERFASMRLKDRGQRPGSRVTVGTVNKDLRIVRVALRKAKKWGDLKDVPQIELLQQPRHHKRYVEDQHFGLMYESACEASYPQLEHVSPGQWWRALLMFAMCTGWRITEVLALRWRDVSLDKGYAITRASDNKAGRDESVPLAQAVVDHLRPMFSPTEQYVFPWPHDKRRLWKEFHAIQRAAGIELDCIKQHEHKCTDACGRYSFHDLRRAFATMNVTRMAPKQLQSMMRHRSFATTELYIKYAESARPAAVDVFVPSVCNPSVNESEAVAAE